MVAILGLSVGGVLAQDVVIQQFPVNRDVGINGYQGEHFTNTGASEAVRAAKSNHHAALFDWDTDAINDWLAENPGTASATFHIFPRAMPGEDVLIETVESENDWEEGDDAQGGCCGQFGWTEGTPAVTHQYAQTYHLGGVVDEDESVPWVNDEDGSEYGFMQRGNLARAIPNFTNSAPFELLTWVVQDFISAPLDDEVFEALLEDENNRGLRLAARGQSSNWKVSMREAAGGLEAAFLEVTVVPAAPPTTGVFARGDANSDGKVNLTDAIRILGFLFSGDDGPPCGDAADTDDDGKIILTDAIRIMNWLFLGADAPPPPSPSAGTYVGADCGPDPTEDMLSCDSLAETCMP